MPAILMPAHFNSKSWFF